MTMRKMRILEWSELDLFGEPFYFLVPLRQEK